MGYVTHGSVHRDVYHWKANWKPTSQKKLYLNIHQHKKSYLKTSESILGNAYVLLWVFNLEKIRMWIVWATAGHQGPILHFWGALMSTFFIYSQCSWHKGEQITASELNLIKSHHTVNTQYRSRSQFNSFSSVWFTAFSWCVFVCWTVVYILYIYSNIWHPFLCHFSALWKLQLLPQPDAQ